MPGTAADTVIRIGLKALGLDPDRDVSLRAIGNTPVRLQAMAGSNTTRRISSRCFTNCSISLARSSLNTGAGLS
jgi:hypothetical protein